MDLSELAVAAQGVLYAFILTQQGSVAGSAWFPHGLGSKLG